MPSYEFVCALCNHHQVVRRSIAERDDDVPECHGQPMMRVFNAPAIVYKAAGHTKGASPLEKLGGSTQ